MDFATKEIFKRYASIAIGRPISPVFLNILVTSVCDMRCTHCFFTEELDDRPRKKLQMKSDEIGRISETLGGNLGVLVLAVLNLGFTLQGISAYTFDLVLGIAIIVSMAFNVTLERIRQSGRLGSST